MMDREDIRDPRDILEELEAIEEAKLDPDMGLITDYLSGELSEEQRAIVEIRLETDPDFYDLASPLLLVEKLRPPRRRMSHDELLRSWLQLRQRIGLPPIPGQPVPGIEQNDPDFQSRRRARRIAALKRPLVAAAVLAFLLLLPVGVIQYQEWQDRRTIDTEYLHSLSTSLPDGSSITVMQGSRASYSKSGFNHTDRSIRLTGEATFQVVQAAANPPFVVWTDAARVRVTGTTFTVHAYGDEPTIVSVQHGTVEVYTRDSDGAIRGEPLILKAGQRARIVRDWSPAPMP